MQNIADLAASLKIRRNNFRVLIVYQHSLIFLDREVSTNFSPEKLFTLLLILCNQVFVLLVKKYFISRTQNLGQVCLDAFSLPFECF
jgi:hypothetical protein